MANHFGPQPYQVQGLAPSAGTALLVMTAAGLFCPPGADHVIAPGRATMGIVECSGTRQSALASVYLEVHVGLNQSNLGILADLFAIA